MFNRLLLLCALSSMGTALVSAQEVSAGITGRVTDSVLFAYFAWPGLFPPALVNSSVTSDHNFRQSCRSP